MARRNNRDLPACARTFAMLLLGGVSIAKGHAASAPPPEAVPDGFTFAAGGDMIGPYHAFPDSTDGEFLRVVSLIRSADLAFANQEGSIFDLETFQGYPAAENGGGYPQQRY